MSCATATDRPRRRDKGKPAMKGAAVPAKADKPAPGSTDLDRPLKLATAQALASAGFYVRTNVVLSEPRSVDGKAWVADVTDVDVLAVAHGIDFRADLSCTSCKGGSAVSVLHETFALAGVMRYLHSARGYGVFAKKRTQPHMIALAQQLDVMVMDDDEWQHWRKRVAGPFVVPSIFEDGVEARIASGVQKWSNLAPLMRYLHTEFWYYRDYRNVQSLIGWLRRSAEHLNGSPLAQYIVLDAIGLLSLAVLQLCEFVNTSGLLHLKETIPPYLFGGVATYRSRRDLLGKVEELLRKKNVMDADQTMPRLDPAYLTDLMELVLRFCSRPHAAVRVPQQLNILAGQAAARVSPGAAMAPDTGQQENDLTQKLAFDLIGLVARAAALPDVLTRELLQTPLKGSAQVRAFATGTLTNGGKAPDTAPTPNEKPQPTNQPDLLAQGPQDTEKP
jgi:hypothetical protein